MYLVPCKVLYFRWEQTLQQSSQNIWNGAASCYLTYKVVKAVAEDSNWESHGNGRMYVEPPQTSKG